MSSRDPNIGSARFIDRPVLIGMALLVLLTLVCGGIDYRNTRQLRADAHLVDHTHQVLDSVHEVLSTVKDAETGQRGFLITGDDSYLKPYNDALEKIQSQITTLTQLTTDNPSDQQHLSQIRGLIQTKLDELARTVELRRTQGFAAAQQVVQTNAGKQSMDNLRAVVAQMDDEEHTLLVERESADQRAYLVAVISVAMGTLLGLAAAIAFIELLRRYISTQTRAAAAIHEQREWLRTTLTSIGDGVIATDPQGRITFLNNVAEDLTGWKEADAAGQPLPEVFRIVNEQTRGPVENPVDKVLRSGLVVGLANHTILISRYGHEIPIHDSGAPIRDTQGAVLGVVLVFRDATEERAAFDAKARLAAVVEFSGDAMITKNLTGIIQSWNSGAQRLFGYSAAEVVGKHVTLLFPPDRLGEEDRILDRLRSGQPFDRFQTIRVAKDGTPIWVSVVISPLMDESGQVVGASKIVRDIREIVAAREALLREKELLATTLASIGDGVIVTDALGLVTFLNAEAQRLTGWTNDQALGKSLVEIFRIINEQTRQTVESPVDKVIRLGSVVGLANHTLLLSRDGREIPIDDSGAPIRIAGGPLLGVVLVFRDFSAQKEGERERNKLIESERAARTEAEQASRMKDEFLATLSHELRTPLNAILGWSRLIEDQPNDAAMVGEGIGVITRNVKIQADLIADLLDMSAIVSGKVHLNLTNVRISEVVASSIESVRHVADSKGVTIESPASVNGDKVRGDASRLQQIISNLLSNAVKFTPRGGKVEVAISPDNSQVQIEVRDTGIGIKPDLLPRLFERFRQGDASSTRRFGGLGLGLAIVKHLVELHGGTVEASSPGEGHGATLTVRLPTIEPELPHEQPDPLRRHDHRRAICDDIDLTGRKILAIDDQPDSRELVARILTECSAQVEVAASADEGLKTLQLFRPDIVLCDIGMPGKDGYSFVKELRARGDQTPALAVTAFARPEDREQTLQAGYQGHVAKPLEPRELVMSVAKMLGAAS